jgi:hypothetical protein
VKVKLEAVRGLIGKPGFSLLGDVGGMIVEDQLDRCAGRIGGVEKFEEFDESAAAMAILDQGMNLAGDEIAFANPPPPRCHDLPSCSLVSNATQVGNPRTQIESPILDNFHGIDRPTSCRRIGSIPKTIG